MGFQYRSNPLLIGAKRRSKQLLLQQVIWNRGDIILIWKEETFNKWDNQETIEDKFRKYPGNALRKKHFYLQTHVWTASQTKQASALCLPTRSNIAVRWTLMGRYLCPLVEAYQCLFLFFQTHLYFTILGRYVNRSSYILDTIYGSIYYLCLKIA